MILLLLYFFTPRTVKSYDRARDLPNINDHSGFLLSLSFELAPLSALYQSWSVVLSEHKSGDGEAMMMMM